MVQKIKINNRDYEVIDAKEKMRNKMFRRFGLKEYVPIKDKMYKDKMWARILQEPSFKLCFKRNISDSFFCDLEKLYTKDRTFITNTILQVSGETGSSKSLNVISLAKKIDKKFSQETNVKFFDNELLKEFEKDPQDTVLIRDESPNKGIFGMGSTRIENQLSVVGDTARKRGISLIFVEPRFKRNDIAKWYLETIDIGSVKRKGKTYRVNRLGIKEPKTEMFLGCILLEVLPEDDEDWIGYNKRKDKFINGVLGSDFTGAKMDYVKVAEDLLDEMDTEVYKTIKEKKLFILKKYPNYTNQEIEMILTAIKIQNRIGDG